MFTGFFVFGACQNLSNNTKSADTHSDTPPMQQILGINEIVKGQKNLTLETISNLELAHGIKIINGLEFCDKDHRDINHSVSKEQFLSFYSR